ncbi:MAG: hypothetical protein HQ509_05570 [Candidatus Marinimicrobia bacterium]|nr:hypothetical protein [Candidatus Neomarinimicrobiota bacterium]
MKNRSAIWYYLSIAIILVSCSPATYITNKVGETFEQAGYVYQSENDPILVREAFPFNLKTLDILLASSPNNESLLESASSAYTMYAYAFILEDAKRMKAENYQASKKEFSRALNLFLRGKEYGIRALEQKYPNIREILVDQPSVDEFSFQEDDIELIYWTAVAIAGTISSSLGNSEYLIHLPMIGWLFEHALRLNADWNNGSIYTAMISYSISRPDAGTNAEQLARMNFDKAIAASHGLDCSPYVSLAETVSIKTQNRKEFEELLKTALEIDVDQDLNNRLANILAQDRAKWLLEQTDELFY